MPNTRSKRRDRSHPQETHQDKRLKINEPPREHGNYPELSWDIWYLIADALGENNRNDLLNLCLVSKERNAQFTSALYRSIVLNPASLPVDGVQPKDEAVRISGTILRRLLNTRDDKFKPLVKELTLKPVLNETPEFKSAMAKFRAKESLSRLIQNLPNLCRVRLEFTAPLSHRLIQTLENHPRGLDIQLLSEDGMNPPPRGQLLPWVSKINAFFPRGPSTRNDSHRATNMHSLLLSCPNVKSFSIGKLLQEPPIPEPTPSDVEWTSSDKLPPIQSLSINGGQIGGPNWARWEETFCWPSLSSLSVGPLSMHACATLNRLKGQARFLQSFTYLCACSHSQARLSQFLASFNTLKSLEVTKTFCFIKDVALHTQLTTLSLHVNEWSGFRQEKATLSSEDLEYLDARCPNLQILAVDINPDEEEWPSKTLRTLATKFDKLRVLSLHIRYSRATQETNPVPVLTRGSAENYGEIFYGNRWTAFDKSNNLCFLNDTQGQFPGQFEKLVLKTGEPLEYPYKQVMKFELLPPLGLGRKPQLRVVETGGREDPLTISSEISAFSRQFEPLPRPSVAPNQQFGPSR